MPLWLWYFFAITGIWFWASILCCSIALLFRWAWDQRDAEEYSQVTGSYGGTD